MHDTLPMIGSAMCVCAQHQVTVHADIDPDTRLDQHLVSLEFWKNGSDFAGRPPWGMRLRLAWSWLRGNPQTVQGILLSPGQYAKLMSALRRAADRTWGPDFDPN